MSSKSLPLVLIASSKGSGGGGDEGMIKRVASRRSEAGSGEHRSAGPPPSESVRAGAGMAAGRGGLPFGEGPGREGRKPSQKAVGSWASSPGGPPAHQLGGLGQVPPLLCAPVSSAVNPA